MFGEDASTSSKDQMYDICSGKLAIETLRCNAKGKDNFLIRK